MRVAIVVVACALGCGDKAPPTNPTPATPSPSPPPPATWPLPDGWRTEIIPFPLGFAPSLAHRGVEELRFAPGFFDPAAPDYWAYAFVWRLDDPADLDAGALGAELTTYFRGLVAAVDGDKKRVVPDAAAITATARPGGGFDLAGRVFDVFGDARAIDLAGSAERRACPNGGSLWIVTFMRAGNIALKPQLDDLARTAACGQTPVEPPPKPPVPATTLRGHVSIGKSVAAGVARRGTLFATWLTTARAAAMAEGKVGLQDFVDMLTRYVVVGSIDLSAATAKVPFSFPVAPGEIVVVLTLDSKREMFGSLTNKGGAGNLFGYTQPIAIASGDNDAGVVVLDQVQAVHPTPDACKGPRHHLITVDAPEVAGSIGNPTRRRACAILPATYARRRACRYPVIFELPGWGSTDSEMVGAFPHVKTIDVAAKATKREAIVVVIDTSTRVGSSYMVDSPVNGAWDRFVTTNLIPAIDRELRTIATPAARAITGHSTGGFGAMSYGLRHPESISVVTASAPDGLDVGSYLFGDDNAPKQPWLLPLLRLEHASGGPGFMASWAADWSPDASHPRGYAWPIDPATGVEIPAVADRWRAAGPSSWLHDPARAETLRRAFSDRIYLTVGAADEAGLRAPTERFASQLAAAGIPNTLVVHPALGHLDVEPLLLGAYRFMLANLPPPACK